MKHVDSGLKIWFLWRLVIAIRFHTEGWCSGHIRHLVCLNFETHDRFHLLVLILVPLYVGVGWVHDIERR